MGFNAYMYTCMTIFMHFVLFFNGITSMRIKKKSNRWQQHLQYSLVNKREMLPVKIAYITRKTLF